MQVWGMQAGDHQNVKSAEMVDQCSAGRQVVAVVYINEQVRCGMVVVGRCKSGVRG